METESKELIPLLPLSYKLHPLQDECITHFVPAYSSLFQALVDAKLDAAVMANGGTRVFLNTWLVPREEWNSVLVLPGDIVSVAVLPGNQKGLRIMLMAVVMIAAIATQQYYLAAGATAIEAAAAGAVVSLAGSLAVNALVPPQQPNLSSKQKDAPSYIEGMKNRFEPYAPLTRLYGKHRHWPNHCSMPYTELKGQNQYFRCAFLIGKGKYALSQHKIHETDLDDYEDVKIRQYYIDPDYEIDGLQFDLFPNDVFPEALNVELTVAADWITRTTQPNTDEVSLQFTLPHCYSVDNDGDTHPATVDLEVQYAPAGTSAWQRFNESQEFTIAEYFTRGSYPYTDCVEGPLALEGATVVGQTSGASGIVRKAGWQYHYVWTGLTYEVGQEQVSVPFWTGVRVELDDPEVQFISNEPVVFTAIGTLYTTTVKKAFDYGTIITTESLEVYKYGLTIDFPSRGQWDVRVRRTNNPDNDEHNDTYWTLIQSITHECPVKARDVTIVVLRIRATGQLNGIVDEYNCISEALVEAYDPVSGWHLVKTRNAAWAFTDVLIGNSTKAPLPKSRLDLPAIRAWAQSCAESNPPRNFDAVVDFRTNVWDILQMIATVGLASRGITFESKVTVVEDKPQSVAVQAFGEANSWDYEGEKTFVDLPHCLKIRFVNEEKGYIQDERPIYDDGYDANNATIFETWDLIGCSNPRAVWRWGRRQIACGKLQPERHRITTNIGNLVCSRGKLVKFAHDVVSIGLGQGLIKSFTLKDPAGQYIDTITLDNIFPMQAGGSYGIRVVKYSGAQVTATVATLAGENLTITVTTNLTAAGIAAGNLVFYGTANEETMDVLVQRIDPGADLSARLTLIPYNEGIYTSDTMEIPPWNSHITLPPIINRTPPKPEITGTNFFFHRSRLDDTGRMAIMFSFSWDLQTSKFDRTNFQKVRGFEIQYRKGTDKWTSIARRDADARSATFTAQNNATYDVRVRSYSLPGAYSDWDRLDDTAVSLAWPAPPAPTGLQVKGGGSTFTSRGVSIEWTGGAKPGTRVDVKDYRVRAYKPADPEPILLRTERTTDEAFKYTLSMNTQDNGTPIPQLIFRVWSRDKWNTLSETYADLTATNPAPVAPANLTSELVSAGIRFEWDENPEPSFDYYQFRTKVGEGSWTAWRRIGKNYYFYNIIDSAALAATKPTIYFEVRSVDCFKQSNTSSTSANWGAPAAPTGLQIKGGGSVWTTTGVVLEWTQAEPNGVQAKDWRVKVYTAGDVLLRTETATDTLYRYSLSDNIKDQDGGTPLAGLKFRVYARDKWNTLSDTYASLTATNAAPAQPANIGTNRMSGGVEFYWDPNTEKDFLRFEYRLKYGAAGSWSPWRSAGKKTHISNYPPPSEKASLGWNMPVYIEVKAYDVFEQASAVTAANVRCGRMQIAIEDSNFTIDTEAGANLVLNAGGELTVINDDDATVLANWPETVTGGAIERVATGGNQSNGYIKLTRSSANVQANNRLNDRSNTRYIEVEPGETYEWGGDAKTGGGGVNGRIALFQRDKDKASVTSNSLATTETTWTALSSRTTMQATTRFVYFAIQTQDANGWAGFDNLYLRKVDSLSWSWSASGDRTKIDGGNIYASSSLAIGGITFASAGIQLQYNGGSPQFYCGDGSDSGEFFKYTAAGGIQISTAKPNAFTVRSGGNIKIESGGDLILVGQADDQAEIKFWVDSAGGASYTVFSCDYTNAVTRLYPPADNVGSLNIGQLPGGSYRRFGSIDIAAKNSVKLRALYGAALLSQDANLELTSTSSSAEAVLKAQYQSGTADYVQIQLYSADDTNYIDFEGYDDGNNYSVRFSLSAANPYIGPTSNKVIDIGRSSYAFDDVYADDFQNVADFLHLDSKDDLYELSQIKGSGVIDPRTGLELIDDDTIPVWLLTKDKTDKATILRDKEGRPYLALKTIVSLLMGCCRQLNEITKGFKDKDTVFAADLEKVKTKLKAVEEKVK